jgi:acetyl esterase
VIYLHGGGFVMGSLDSYDEICADIAATTGNRVISVAYRLSPEHAHPAALTDAFSVTQAVTGPVILVGDSAGGNLAAAVAQQIAVLGQVLIYPMLGGDPRKGSYLTHANAPMLTTADVAHYNAVRGPIVDATTQPLRATDFSNLPPTIAFGAECDPLCDDACDYADAITTAGGQATFVSETGLPHGYLRARHSVPRAAQAFKRICAAISALGGKV